MYVNLRGFPAEESTRRAGIFSGAQAPFALVSYCILFLGRRMIGMLLSTVMPEKMHQAAQAESCGKQEQAIYKDAQRHHGANESGN